MKHGVSRVARWRRNWPFLLAFVSMAVPVIFGFWAFSGRLDAEERLFQASIEQREALQQEIIDRQVGICESQNNTILTIRAILDRLGNPPEGVESVQFSQIDGFDDLPLVVQEFLEELNAEIDSGQVRRTIDEVSQEYAASNPLRDCQEFANITPIESEQDQDE